MTRPMSIEKVNEYGHNAVRIDIEGRAVLLDASDLDSVIEHLSALRAMMRPEVPKTPVRTHQYVIEVDPCWHTEKHPLHDGAMLFLRHSGLGWTGFALPVESLAQMHQALSKHLEASLEVHGMLN